MRTSRAVLLGILIGLLLAGTGIGGYLLLRDDDPSADELAASLKAVAETAGIATCEKDSGSFWTCFAEFDGIHQEYGVQMDAENCWVATALVGEAPGVGINEPVGPAELRDCID
jgi:hypothetical protein